MIRKLSAGFTQRLSQVDEERERAHRDAASDKKKSMIPKPTIRASSVDRSGKRSTAPGTSSISRMGRRSNSADCLPQLVQTPMSCMSSGKMHSTARYRRYKIFRKDTRPLTTKPFQSTALAKVRKYFQANHMTINYTLLDISSRNMTLKMFVEIMNFLLVKLFPNVNLTLGNYTELLPTLMKIARYPGAVTRSWLVSANTPHSWPHVLGIISWLVNLVNIEDPLPFLEVIDDIFDTESAVELFKSAREQYVQYQCEGVINDDLFNPAELVIKKKHMHTQEHLEQLKQTVERRRTVMREMKVAEEKHKQLAQKMKESRLAAQKQEAQNQSSFQQVEAATQILMEKDNADKEKKKEIQELEEAIAIQPYNKIDEKRLNKEVANLKYSVGSLQELKEENDKKLFSEKMARSAVVNKANKKMEEINKLLSSGRSDEASALRDIEILPPDVESLHEENLHALTKQLESKLLAFRDKLWEEEEFRAQAKKQSEELDQRLQQSQLDLNKLDDNYVEKVAELKTKKAEYMKHEHTLKSQISEEKKHLNDITTSMLTVDHIYEELNELKLKVAKGTEHIEFLKQECCLFLQDLLDICAKGNAHRLKLTDQLFN